jgi:toxin ParE1/3/4
VSGRVVKLPRALHDLDDAAASIQQRGSPQRAIRFLQAADSTLATLAGMPGLGVEYEPDEPVYTGLRFFPIARHRNYIVFYRPLPDGVEVLRVLHGARDLHSILAEDFGIKQDDGDEDREDE